MRTLQETNRVRNGIVGVVVLALVVGVGQSFASVPMLFATPTYFAEFHDTGGINPGDKVRIAGVDVGRVQSTEIDGDKVRVGYTLGGVEIGRDSRAAIRTDTILGRRNLEIEPRGQDVLRPRGVLPLDQTTTPYQLYDAVNDVTTAASGWDTETVKRSLNVLAETVDQTAPHLSAALQGVARFSDTIGKRDDQIKQLLANANKIAGVLGSRSEQINQLLVNSNSLLAAVNERTQAVSLLLERVSAFSTQVQGFIDENPNLNRVLEQLRTISDVLAQRRLELSDTLAAVGKYMTALAESLASGPYFKVLVSNLLPYQMLQPFVDAAFKERGLDPEAFWRSAGLPAFRFPDPNGQRQANGAPPAAPVPLEGTPEYPGPGVPPGSPCSYTPPADGLPRPQDPLPCAQLNQGPFGPVPGGFAPPDVAVSAPNPDAPPAAPGVPSAALPGQPSPPVQGVPSEPLAPGPPGARTVPVGPAPGPAEFTPAIAPVPPVPPESTPPPPGPGPQLPPAGTEPLPGNPPFLPPGSQG